MKAQSASVWALALWFSAMVPTGAGLYLLAGDIDVPEPGRWGFQGFPGLFAITLSTVGALVVRRRLGNAIGWLLCAGGIQSGLQMFFEQYAVRAVLAQPGSLPFAESVAWVRNWFWILGVGMVVGLVLPLFPTGRPISRRWKAALWWSIFSTALMSFAFAFQPGPLLEFPFVENQLGFGAADGPMNLVLVAGGGAMGITVLLSLVSTAVRFRMAKGIERQQQKWVLFSMAAAAIAFLAVVGEGIGTRGGPTNPFISTIAIISVAAIPVAMGVAILRHGLFDIDVVINRALVYGVLTVTLVGTYFGSVVLLQMAFRGFTGQGGSVAIVISTLAIAALFMPLRRGVQDTIDRRFYRRKYDAARTLEAFSATARDEVDIEKITNELVAVVEETMQPAHVSLWLKN